MSKLSWSLAGALGALVVLQAGCGGESDRGSPTTNEEDAGQSQSDDDDQAELDAGSRPDEGEVDAAEDQDVAEDAAEDAGETQADAEESLRDVEIAFEARVSDKPFSCEASYSGLGTLNTLSTTVSDFRFYVHDVKLLRADGSEEQVRLTQGGAWQYENVGLLDFEDRKGACATTGTAETNKSVWGKVPSGKYDGISFVLGVPEAFNHTDTAGKTTPSPLNIQAMAWNWATGRKFLRIDLASTMSNDGGAPTDAGKFVLHLGSTACPQVGAPGAGEPDSCKNPNRATVTLRGFDPSASKIVFDLAAAVSRSNLTFNTPGTATGCMSAGNDPECSPIFEQFGLSLATGLPDPALKQTVFSVAAK